jgi:hypothetical protein
MWADCIKAGRGGPNAPCLTGNGHLGIWTRALNWQVPAESEHTTRSSSSNPTGRQCSRWRGPLGSQIARHLR